MRDVLRWTLPLACVVLCGGRVGAEETINPFPRPILVGKVLHQWTFDKGAGGWGAMHGCTVSASGGQLKIRMSGDDPYLTAPCKLPAARRGVAVRVRMKCAGAGAGEFFWTNDRNPGWSAGKRRSFRIAHDGQWHEYEVLLPVVGRLTALRLDPGIGAGTAEVEWFRVHDAGPHPLEISQLRTRPDRIDVHVKNHGAEAVTFAAGGAEHEVGGGKTAVVAIAARGSAAFEAFDVEVRPRPKSLPAIRRTTVLIRPDAKPTKEWRVLGAGGKGIAVDVPPDGSGARVRLDGHVVAYLAPIVLRGGKIPPLKLESATASAAIFVGRDLRVRLAVGKTHPDELDVHIESAAEVEGPVVRAVGALEQGLFAGLEYLGKGERSSSKLDIETADHLRFRPDPLKVTMPLMAFRTADPAAVTAMTWRDMTLRPTYATPNFFDGSADHRMSLRGRKIDATIRFGRWPHVEEAVAWAVQKRGGLPPVPKAPRDRAGQWKLAMAAIDGPIGGQGGWGHCAEAKWKRQPYADIASTIWRITGEAPKLDRIAPGGAHVPNDAIYFVTGRAEQWLRVRKGQCDGTIRAQKADGSFRYKGKFSRGHFEDTSSGACARPARVLLEFARSTGYPPALDAGVKTLEYMKRFRTPRGAQTWELSLHTPDVLASADLVWSYVLGYELTGRKDFLAEARRWALSGVPFVYLWDDRPIMRYASPPVFGATNWRAPLWIGLPVQWCGGVYAYALTKLAPHDRTIDWTKLARGMLLAGEQMQYPSGPLVGCLPDVFYLRAQKRAGPSINPCALASLRMALAGQTDALAAAVSGDGKHRVVAPFPVTIVGGEAVVRARKGVKYQVIVDGKRIVDVTSKGTDRIALE